MKRYFDVLGLPINADQQQIKKQYRKLAMRLHPDKNPSPEAKSLFIKITEAYNYLSAQTSNQPGLISDRKKKREKIESKKHKFVFTTNSKKKKKKMNAIFKVYLKAKNGALSKL